jgi:translation initiation factor IF-1
MKRQGLRIIALATLGVSALYFTSMACADDKPRDKQALQVQGKVVKTGKDTIILETPEKKQVTLYVGDQTKYTMNNKAVQLNDVRVGATISAGYVTDGDRWMANTVVVGVDQDRDRDRSAPPDKGSDKGSEKPERGTMLEGEIIGIEGEDQLIIKTPDGKEVTVFVDPKTRIMLANKERKFSDLKKGGHIGVEYNEREKKYYAANVQDVTLAQGQVVKVVGKDQVLIKTADGKEVIVFIDPQTRFQLTDQGGTITDLKPGADINVYYGVHEDRNMARRVWLPRRR